MENILSREWADATRENRNSGYIGVKNKVVSVARRREEDTASIGKN